MLQHATCSIYMLYCLIVTIATIKVENSKTDVWNRSVEPTTVATSKMTVTEPANINTTSKIPNFISNIPQNAAANKNNVVPSFAETSDAHMRMLCACNLHLNKCDINCCCDADCPKDILKVFNCQLEPTRLEDFQYSHGLPSCGVNDGWLCVFRNNQKTEKHTPKLNFDTSHRHKWPVAMSVQNDQLNLLNFYRFGETIKLMNMKTKQIQNFELPFAFITANCDIKYPIKHLISRKYACYAKNLEEFQINKQQIMQLAWTTKLLNAPKLQQRTLDFIGQESYLGNITVQSCRLILNEITNCSFLQNADNFTAEQDEQLLYTSDIAVKIYHNYTNILEALVTFIERETTNELDNCDSCDNDYWQYVEIDFIYHNMRVDSEKQSESLSAHRISGPLGYLQGEPLIVARLLPNNTLDYFHNSNSEHQNMLSLFETQQNVCHKSNSTQDHINFGINVQKQCMLQLDNETFSTLIMDKQFTNYTAICHTLQRLAWMQLFNLPENANYNDYTHFVWEHLSALYVSQLGRPKNQVNKWTPLQIQNLEFIPLIAVYDEEANSFTCRNMLLSIVYEFHILHLEEDQIPHQAQVKRAALILDHLHDLEFSLVDEEQIELPLLINIMFYDTIMQSNSTNGFGNIIHFYLILGLLIILTKATTSI